MLKNVFTFVALMIIVVILLFIILVSFSGNDIANSDEIKTHDCIGLLNNRNKSVKNMRIVGIKDSSNPWILHYVNCSSNDMVNIYHSFGSSKNIVQSSVINFKNNKRVYRLSILKYDGSTCILPLYLTGRNEGIINTGTDSVYQCNDLILTVDNIFKKNTKYVYK